MFIAEASTTRGRHERKTFAEVVQSVGRMIAHREVGRETR